MKNPRLGQVRYRKRGNWNYEIEAYCDGRWHGLAYSEERADAVQGRGELQAAIDAIIAEAKSDGGRNGA